MRKFMKIVESVTNDMALNNEIEAKLATIAEGDRTMVLDGLEVIMNHGSINVGSWIDAMAKMWPSATATDLRRIFETITSEFPHFVTTRGDGQYSWNEARHTEADVDMSGPEAQAASMQIEFVSLIHDIMKELEAFMPGEVVADFVSRTGMGQGMAEQLVQHVIDSSSAMVKQNPLGGYVWDEPKRSGGLSFLRDLDGYTPRA
jgi:hypothetical protein